jgi:hypothetical protein
MTAQAKALAGILAMLAAFAWGFMLGSSMAPKTHAAAEPARQEIRHPSGALTLQRDPDTAPPAALTAPPEPGAVRVRAITLELPPTTTPEPLQLDLWKLPDGTHRVTTGGQTLKVTTGTDYPISTAAPKTWAAGLGITHQKQPAAWIMRERGPLVGLVMATKAEFTLGIGWKF